MTTPSATIASNPAAARRAAATGNSNAPGTRTSVTSRTCESARARRAPSSRPSMTVACHCAATTATRSSAAPSTVDSIGAPSPLIPSHSPRSCNSRPREAAESCTIGQMPGSCAWLLEVEVVAHAVAFGFQVTQVLGVGVHGQGYPSDDAQPVALEAGALGRVVRQQPHRAHAQVVQDLRAGAVVARVGRQAELEVGVECVRAGVLQLIGLQLVQQADAPALVTPDVQHDSTPLAGDSC